MGKHIKHRKTEDHGIDDVEPQDDYRVVDAGDRTGNTVKSAVCKTQYLCRQRQVLSDDKGHVLRGGRRLVYYPHDARDDFRQGRQIGDPLDFILQFF